MMTHGHDWVAVLADFLFYVFIIPVFSSSIMKSMYLVQAGGQAASWRIFCRTRS